MRTIEQLNTLLEELEKRIRTISTAQKTLNQINEILAYIQSVQDYLQELQTTFDSHVQECDDYSTDISNLQTQIDTINQTINNLSTDSETTNQLKTTLAEIQTKVDEFIGNSSTTAENLENDISALQTDLGSCQDDITDIESEISAINSSIGEQNTTITNLQTTQTNLQTTQSSQASTINNINSRLTTCENNVSTLTGGVDVSEIDNRIDALENNNLDSIHDYCKVAMLFNIENSVENAKTPFYYYYTKETHYIFQKYTFHYISNGTGTLTIKLLQNGTQHSSFTINLSKNPSEYTIFSTYHPIANYQNVQFAISVTDPIKFTFLEIDLTGRNTFSLLYDKELKVECYNGEIYVTRYIDGVAKADCFTSDTLDIENLSLIPNTYNYGMPRYTLFGPFFTKQSDFTPYSDSYAFYHEYTHNYIAIHKCNKKDLTFNQYAGNKYDLEYSAMPTLCGPIHGCIIYIKNKQPHRAYLCFGNYHYEIDTSPFQENCWIYASLPHNNNLIELQDTFSNNETWGTLLYNQDGYVYYTKGFNVQSTWYIKIAKIGNYATSYIQADGSINVYITRYNQTEKYNVVFADNKFEVAYIETIDDCYCLYEILDNKVIKETSTGWVVESTITE